VEKTVMNIGIKTGDEVKLTLDWMLKRRSNAEQRSAPPDPASHPPAASSQAARSELGPSP
jgi:hypothetical protein